MSQDVIGWVMDKDTSKRRLCVSVLRPGVVGVLVEVYGQQAKLVELDAEGAGVLVTMVAEALARVQQQAREEA